MIKISVCRSPASCTKSQSLANGAKCSKKSGGRVSTLSRCRCTEEGGDGTEESGFTNVLQDRCSATAVVNGSLEPGMHAERTGPEIEIAIPANAPWRKLLIEMPTLCVSLRQSSFPAGLRSLCCRAPHSSHGTYASMTRYLDGPHATQPACLDAQRNPHCVPACEAV